MSHLHLPDGVLPIWLILLGFGLSGLALFWSLFVIRKEKKLTSYSLVGFFVALMLIGMTLEIIPLGYHLNLSSPAGIILGPAFGVLAAFVVNLFLALIGHGGLTVLGLNTLVIAVEAIIAFYLFFRLVKIIPSKFASAMIATIVALAFSTALSFGIIAIGTKDLHEAVHHHEEKGILSFVLFSGEENQHHEEEEVNLTRLAYLMFGLGSIGWVLEGIITGLFVAYIAKIKPELFNK